MGLLILVVSNHILTHASLRLLTRTGISRKRHRSLGLLGRALLYSVLKRQKLLRTERLVMNLRSGLNEVLQVRACEEVAQVHKFAVVRVLDINHTPAVPATTDRLAVNYNVVLGSDNGEWNNRLSTA